MLLFPGSIPIPRTNRLARIVGQCIPRWCIDDEYRILKFDKCKPINVLMVSRLKKLYEKTEMYYGKNRVDDNQFQEHMKIMELWSIPFQHDEIIRILHHDMATETTIFNNIIKTRWNDRRTRLDELNYQINILKQEKSRINTEIHTQFYIQCKLDGINEQIICTEQRKMDELCKIDDITRKIELQKMTMVDNYIHLIKLVKQHETNSMRT